jgi:type IV fimbrial biogenesis protein FimT
MRRGMTLIEVTVVVAIIALIAGIGAPAVLRRLDRTRVRHATAEVVSVLALARATALAREMYVSVIFDAADSAVYLTDGRDTLVARAVGAIYGVAVASNRDSATYGPSGLGYGASNQSIVLRRGDVADTIVISRLGRVRD